MNKLIPIENQNQRVLLTSQLAEEYETTERRISENFTRNQIRYIEGKHFYCLEGDILAQFKNQYANCVSVVADRTAKLYLWTEKGALLHAKSLNTDKAWKVYEDLVDTYFKVQPALNAYHPKSTSLGEVANYIKIMRSIMKGNNQSSEKIAEMAESVCKQFNVNIPDDFVNRNPFQMIINANFFLAGK